MKKNFFIGWLIVVVFGSIFIYLYWTPGHLELVSYKNSVAELNWHGVSGTELKIWGFHRVRSSFGDYKIRDQIVNDGEAFIVGVPDICIEIYYHYTKVRIDSGGSFSEEFVFYPFRR